MTAASVIATPLPVAAAPIGEARASAPGAENDTNAFADLIADADATDALPAPSSEDAAMPAPSADAAPDAPKASTKTGLLSGAAFMTLQQTAETTPPTDTAPTPPVVVAADAGDAAATDDASPAPAKAKEEAAVSLDQTAPAVPTPIIPVPSAPTPAASVAAAALAAEATLKIASAPTADAPLPVTGETSEAPPAPATASASTAAAFEQAITNASAGAAKTQQPATAASDTQDASTTPANPAVSAKPSQPTTTAAPSDGSAVAAPAAPPLVSQARIEAAPAPPTSPLAPAPAQTAAPAPPPIIIPTNLSHLSQATLETTVQIAAQISRKLEGRSTRFEMGLTPEGLGRVDVSLDIDSGGQLTARLAFDNPLAATELRGKADELRRELTDAGFTIAHDGLDFSERQPSSSNGGFDRQQGRAFASASRIAADADLSQPAPAAWMSLSLTRSGVDMKV